MKQLNNRGFTHYLVVALIVLAVGVGGAFYLVASHADTPCGNAASGPTSAPDCTPTSAPTSAPTSGPVASASGSCSIIGVPSSVTTGQVLQPTVIFSNTGSQSYNPSASTVMRFAGVGVNSVNTTTATVSSSSALQAGKTVNVRAQSYNVPNGKTYGSYTVTSSSPSFSCTANFTIGAPSKSGPQ